MSKLGGAESSRPLDTMTQVSTSASVSAFEEPASSELQVLQRMFDLQGCEGFKSGGMQEVLRPANVPNESAQAICSAINGARSACAMPWIVGHLVPPGSIGVICHNGRIEAVPDGRYVLGLHRAVWLGPQALSMQQPLRQGTLTIVRVPRGQVGIARDRGNPILLDAGLHVYNDVNFLFDSLQDLQSEHIHHGPLHVVRVKRGDYAKVWVSGNSGGLEPKLLREGIYVVDSNLFGFQGRVSASEAHVSHGVLHIIQVPKGHVARVFRDNMPRLLAEGCHHIESANFEYLGTSSLKDATISHGTITVVRVNRGEVGLAWQDNQPLFLEDPGTYSFDSPNFQFVRHADITEKQIALGTKKVVTVYSGEVGLSYNRGELHILNPGRHVIDDAAHTVAGFLSTQQMSVRLVSVSVEHFGRQGRAGSQTASSASPAPPIRGSDLLICETRDLVKVGVRADVFYCIADPERAIRKVAKDEIETLVLETAVATLTNIIRSTTLNDIAQSKNPAVVSEHHHMQKVQAAQALGDKPSAPLFFDKAHDEFLSKLHDDFLARYGIEITNIRIESFKIMDEELANNISKQALATAQTESQLANLAGQTEIATKEQERLAAIRQISAQAEAASLRTKADAENTTLLNTTETRARAEQLATETKARAEATALIERAKAEAEAIRLKAQAEAEAIELKAAAEAKRARQLAETPLGAQLSLLSVYADMATKCNEGVEKVVYCDLQSSNVGLFGMPSLQGLSRDLASLQVIDGGKKA